MTFEEQLREKLEKLTPVDTARVRRVSENKKSNEKNVVKIANQIREQLL